MIMKCKILNNTDLIGSLIATEYQHLILEHKRTRMFITCVFTKSKPYIVVFFSVDIGYQWSFYGQILSELERCVKVFDV